LKFNGIIQIAGVKDLKDARVLVRAGIKFIGFPLHLDTNREDISVKEAAKIIAELKRPSYCVLITYLDKADEISDLCVQLGVKRVQIHGDIEIEELSRFKKANPDYFIIKSLIVRKDNLNELVNLVKKTTPYVDAFITDTYDPKTGASGATGKTHNWKIDRDLVRISRRPIILAGGLNPSNVAYAIKLVKPAGVDAHSGVEGKDERKDSNLVKEFVQNAKKAFGDIQNKGSNKGHSLHRK
jgi:phosphoribosylanthranilate isomerase